MISCGTTLIPEHRCYDVVDCAAAGGVSPPIPPSPSFRFACVFAFKYYVFWHFNLLPLSSQLFNKRSLHFAALLLCPQGVYYLLMYTGIMMHCRLFPCHISHRSMVAYLRTVHAGFNSLVTLRDKWWLLPWGCYDCNARHNHFHRPLICKKMYLSITLVMQSPEMVKELC